MFTFFCFTVRICNESSMFCALKLADPSIFFILPFFGPGKTSTSVLDHAEGWNKNWHVQNFNLITFAEEMFLLILSGSVIIPFSFCMESIWKGLWTAAGKRSYRRAGLNLHYTLSKRQMRMVKIKEI